MRTILRIGILAVVASAGFAVRAQVPCAPTFVAGVPNGFQVATATELTSGEAYIRLTNNGAASTVAFPTQNGALGVNMYFFKPDGTMQSCCTCTVNPNSLARVGVRQALQVNPLLTPNSVTVKLVATQGACTLSDGLVAEMVSPTANTSAGAGVTATRIRFIPGTLSAAELARVSTFCSFLPGAGICNGCPGAF